LHSCGAPPVVFRTCVVWLVVLSLGLLSAKTVRATQALQIDASHSAVIFTWNHFGFSHPVARLERLQGTLNLADELTQSSVAMSFDVAGLRSGDAEIDELMKSESYLDAARYPTITFSSTKIDQTGEDLLAVSGNLTIHGISKVVTLTTRINKIGPNPLSHLLTAGFDADATIRRSDFGVAKFIPSVADELTVHITLDAHAARERKRDH
jgi:polyisoprenoid-binding protein YceI